MALILDGDDGISGIDGSAATPAIQGADSNTGITFGTDIVNVVTGGTTRATVDSNGRLGVGVTSPQVDVDIAPTTSSAILRVHARTDTSAEPAIELMRGANTTFGSDTYGDFRIKGSGGNLIFEKGDNGSTAEFLKSDGTYLIGGGSTDTNPAVNNAQNVYAIGEGRARFSADLTVPLHLNRKGNDGTIVRISQDGTSEGTISVSGTTVSYNGAHLSRWSQLPGGVERTEILRGSVLSNIDEMCEWGDEENEQLNRMKVSDVEGDKNVSGVFQAWDDDDDTYTNDFYCAMTGDFVIRIAEGVTVERGDLLMSAGDGTAKPQDDDIIRSKTIAKVTSTNVSCTYADGSFCVPCVLMAC